MLTKQVFEEIIRRRHAEGLPISWDKIEGEMYSKYKLRDFAKTEYGGWANACIEIDCLGKYGHKPTLSAADIVYELKRLKENGHSMKVRDFDPWFYRRVREVFGSYKQAKKKIGIKTEVKYTNTEARRNANKRQIKYTDEELLHELRIAVDECNYIGELHSNHKRILAAISRRHGNIVNFAKKYGVELPPKKDRRIWTDDKIKMSLKDVSEKETNLSANYLIHNGYSSLVYAVKKRYGTWNEGLKALGYEVAYETPQYEWTKELIKYETIRALKDGETPTLSALGRRIRGYVGAVSKYFGSFDEVKEYCGICSIKDSPKIEEEVNKTYRPDLQSEQGIKREIIRLYYVGCPLNYNAIRNKKHHLLLAAKQVFGDWRSAIEYCGLDYNDVSITDNIRSECGEEFELVLGEILTELGINFEKYNHERYDPDFVLSNGNWIDAKLSEWTDVSETVKRYLTECNDLTIVYLVGSKRERRRGKKYCYNHVNVYLLTDKLSEDKRDYYNNRLKEIENKLNANELGSHSA